MDAKRGSKACGGARRSRFPGGASPQAAAEAAIIADSGALGAPPGVCGPAFPAAWAVPGRRQGAGWVDLSGSPGGSGPTSGHLTRSPRVWGFRGRARGLTGGPENRGSTSRDLGAAPRGGRPRRPLRTGRACLPGKLQGWLPSARRPWRRLGRRRRAPGRGRAALPLAEPGVRPGQQIAGFIVPFYILDVHSTFLVVLFRSVFSGGSGRPLFR